MRLLYFLVLPFVLAHCNDNTTTITTKKNINKPKQTSTSTSTRSRTRSSTRSSTRSRTRSSTSKPTPKLKPKNTGRIPIISGKGATLTYFTDSVFQCTTEVPEYGMAVNPLLLGFTRDDWINRFSNVEANKIPWCGKRMKITVNGMSFTGVIIDTCDPVGNPFPDPVTGETIGGKCDYDDVIDLYGEVGRSFLQDAVGDDFYKGDLEWELL
jgi:hypothetical protein